MTRTVNLDDFRTYAGAKVFSGRPRGEEVRRQLGLGRLDAQHEQAVVVIPEDIYTINMSFFLGLFADSVKTYGAEEFAKHYRFEGPEILLRDIPGYIAQAVKETNPLLDTRERR